MTPSHKERYSEFLAHKGRKTTRYADRVVEMVFSLTKKFSREEIVVYLHGEVSPATIYRTVMSLVEAGLLQQIQFNTDVPYFEPTSPNTGV